MGDPQPHLSVNHAVAIIGAGLMGSGIAQVFAAAGHDVAIYDRDPPARASVIARIDSVFALLEQDRASGGDITVHDELQDAVAHAELVIEAAAENLAIKRDVFAQLTRLADDAALLATNTSAIPVHHIAEGLPSASRILGMHFWNPPYLIPLVEVIQSEATDPRNVESAMALLRSVDLEPVHVRADIPGFIGNRLQHALKREAIALVASGVCTAEDVDTVTKCGFGPRLALLGPLEQSDLVGLQLTLQIHETLMPHLDRTAEPHPYLVEKVRKGHTGATTGQGFRRWTPEDADAAHHRVTTGLREAALRRRRHDRRGSTGDAAGISS